MQLTQAKPDVPGSQRCHEFLTRIDQFVVADPARFSWISARLRRTAPKLLIYWRVVAERTGQSSNH
jgi:hypothetical protein